MKKYLNQITTMKNKITLLAFSLNLVLTISSIVYFLAAQSIMEEYKQIKRDEVDKAAREIVEDISLFAPIEELENAVAKDLAALDAKYKNLN